MSKGTYNTKGNFEPASELSQLMSLVKVIRLRWPWLHWRVDFAAGLKLPPRIAGMQMKLQKGKSYPDIFFPHPIGIYHGLFIELKKDISEVYTKDGNFVANPHIREQWQELQRLSGLGYKAVFGFNNDHAEKIIEDYLGG